MTSGLPYGTVTLSPYDSAWPTAFEYEKKALELIFGAHANAIEHVGSTSVPELSATPIIDIAVGLGNFAEWPSFVDQLQTEGYVFMQDRVKPTEVFMPKGPEAHRTHYLHITQFGSMEWNNMVVFRNALRLDSELRQSYERLKTQLAAQYPDNREAYSQGKATFIHGFMQR